MSSTTLQAGTVSPSEPALADVGRNLSLVSPSTAETAPVLPSAQHQAPTVARGRFVSIVIDYWWSGIVVGLVGFDGLILLLALSDCLRFSLRGLSLADAWALAHEAESAGEFLGLALIVFIVFLIALPALTALLLGWLQQWETKRGQAVPRRIGTLGAGRNSSVPRISNANARAVGNGAGFPLADLVHLDLKNVLSPGDANGDLLLARDPQHPLRRRGKAVFFLHLAFTAAIAAFTVLAQGMETLSGWGKGEEYGYSFPSAWLHIVSYLKIAYPSYFLPVFRKYIVRAAGGEHPHLRDVGREIWTEEAGDGH